MKKKNLILSFAVVATMGMVLTGCGNKPEKVTDEVQPETQTEVVNPEEQPLVDEESTQAVESTEATEEAITEEAITEVEPISEAEEVAAGEDFLSANNIKISSLAKPEEGLVAERLFYDGLNARTVPVFEVGETETVIKVYNLRGADEFEKSPNFGVLADFYDRSTGESILKKSDIYFMEDTEAKTLETQDGFAITASWNAEDVVLDEYSVLHYTVITYRISHPANFEVVLQLGPYDYENVKTENEALSSEKHTMLDRPSLLSGDSKGLFFTATGN